MKNTNHNKELRAKFAKKQRPTILPTKVAHLVNDSLAILFFALGVMLVMALLSYSPNDPCWSKSTSTNALAVNNQLGVFGSYMSDILLYNFGYSAWWLVLGTFYFGTQQIMRKFLDAGNLISPYRFICGLILIFASATFEFVVFYGQKTQLPSSWGGSFGSFLFSNLSNLFGEVGVNLLSLLTIAICLSFVFGISWLTIAEKVGEKIEMLLVRSQNLPTISPEKSSLINDEQNVASSPELNTTAHNYFASATVVDSSTTDVFQPQPQDTVDEYDPLGLNFAIPETTNQSTATQTKEYSSLIGNLFKPNPLTNNHNLNEELSTPNTTNNQAHNSGYDNQLLNTKPISSTTNGFNLDDKLFNSVNSSPQANSSTIKNKSADIVTHLESNLASLGVKININNVLTGPIITRYEFIPPRGVNRDQIINLTPQLAQAMSLADLSMLKNIPDKSCMAIEIPNPERSLINLTELLNLASFQNTNNLLPLILGKDSVGELVITDLAKLPHLLLTGNNDTGKSMILQAMILSLVAHIDAEQLKFILLDSQKDSFAVYSEQLVHLFAPVVTTTSKQISNAFKWIIAQIEQRCQLMLKLKTKDISSLNHKINTNLAQGKPILNPFCPVTEPEYLQPLPYLVIIIDELADLIVAEGKDIEKYIIQICQKSQAVGIHLIISTIKPSLELIANIPARLSFQLLNKQQSELILDYSGAETLLDYGDMLLLSPSNPILKRIHSPYIEHDEIQPLLDQLLQYASKKPDTISSNPDSSYDQALDFILTSRRCSISALQTQFGMGYNQACNIINQFIQSGIVQKNKNGSLQVLADKNNK